MKTVRGDDSHVLMDKEDIKPTLHFAVSRDLVSHLSNAGTQLTTYRILDPAADPLKRARIVLNACRTRHLGPTTLEQKKHLQSARLLWYVVVAVARENYRATKPIAVSGPLRSQQWALMSVSMCAVSILFHWYMLGEVAHPAPIPFHI